MLNKTNKESHQSSLKSIYSVHTTCFEISTKPKLKGLKVKKNLLVPC